MSIEFRKWIKDRENNATTVFKSFKPEYLSKLFKVDLDEVLCFCEGLAKRGKLKKAYLAKCPSCNNWVKTINSREELSLEKCVYCNQKRIRISKNSLELEYTI